VEGRTSYCEKESTDPEGIKGRSTAGKVRAAKKKEPIRSHVVNSARPALGSMSKRKVEVHPKKISPEKKR